MKPIQITYFFKIFGAGVLLIFIGGLLAVFFDLGGIDVVGLVSTDTDVVCREDV